MPAADGLAGDTKDAGNLGLVNVVGEQLGGVQAPFLQRLWVPALGGRLAAGCHRTRAPTTASQCHPTPQNSLNPVAVLITRTLAELVPQISKRPPLHSGEHLEGTATGPLEGFMTDLRHYAKRVRGEA